MSEVKSLNITADTYRHRGWMWSDRSIYERFKPHMKLPLWIDRILTNLDGTNLYAVGKMDGLNNTVHLGPIRSAQLSVPESFPERDARYHCRIHPSNSFRVLAERIRAKKPDANKPPRPQWRSPLGTVWEPPMLAGTWVMSREQVKSVGCDKAPEWADRLWVSTSNNEDTFVWVDSKSARPEGGCTNYKAQGAKGIKGHQPGSLYHPDSVLTHGGCLWQLAGVRKKTVWVPGVVKPAPDKLVTATEVLKAQCDMERVTTGRVPSLDELIWAPYGQDIYTQIAAQLKITRAEAKLRAFREAYTIPNRGRKFDFASFDFTTLEQSAFLAPSTPKPRNRHDEERANALDDAMVRHLNEDLPFPIEWATEWNELRARLNKEQK